MPRNMIPALSLMLLLPGLISAGTAQDVNPEILNRFWTASWIAPPHAPLREYGVYHFRKSFDLGRKPDSFVIHVSADNRYRLFVNGTPVSIGPARGDLMHWRFETVDIAPQLVPGRNVLAAVVWNFGEHIPFAQMTDRTAFIVQGDQSPQQIVNTDDSWRVLVDQAYAPLPPTLLHTFVVVGPGDQVRGDRYPWGWQDPEYDDSAWTAPRVLGIGTPRGLGTDLDRLLVPRRIPALEEKPLRLQHLVRADGLDADDRFVEGDATLTIPASSRVSLLLDQTYLTTAYPELRVAGGAGTRITLTYAEALVDEQGQKGNRNETAGRHIVGLKDQFFPDGGKDRLFRPLWFRTYRYVQLDIETAGEPLRLLDFQGRFTAYPFEQRGRFEGSDTTLSKIWQVGWRTARLCAGETYFDCPYYEQLQYVGDTRIQALISLYVAGDDRLMRKAIQLLDDSRLPSGLTQSRYPSAVAQIIPPYSLFWISMVHDYWMHRDDPPFVESFLPGIRDVLGWYESHVAPDAMLGPVPWWNFVDWTEEWPWRERDRIGGMPEGVHEGTSSILTLHLAYTALQASELFDAFGDRAAGAHYRRLAERLKQAVFGSCWDESRGLLADTSRKQVFSQHANIFGVLSDLFSPDQSRSVMKRVLEDPSLIQATFYFRFYLTRALVQTGMADDYIETLRPWRKMLDIGLTTFAEKPEPTRSDCHAWSASPNYELLATVCGINPAEPGFGAVRITPHLGPLQWAEGRVPHPSGPIDVSFKRRGPNGLTADIELPSPLDGFVEWNGTTIALHGGKQHIEID